MMISRAYIEDIIIKRTKLDKQLVLDSVEIPNDSSMGDFAYPAFRIAKVLKKAPQLIAKELALQIDDDTIAKVEAVGGYVNIFLDRDVFVSSTIREIDNAQTPNIDKTIVVEYSSINIAKPFHIGHLSSTVIGGSLYKMYKYLGYRVVGINHLGDWGTQFGKLIYAYKQWGNRNQIEQRGIDGLLELYVKFHELAEKDQSLNAHGREWSLKIEQGDSQAIELWLWFKKITLDEVQKVYDRLGVHFDSFDGESFYIDKIPAVVQELEDKGLLELSDGAKVVKLDQNIPPLLVLRSDGASLYATRDLAAAIYRKATYNFEKCLYVVAYQQNLHFEQLFGTLAKMGHQWASDCVHVQFGMVSLKDGGSLSSRKGNVVLLSSILDDAVNKALSTIHQKNPNLSNKDSIAQAVGVGAVVFGALSSGRIKDIVFDIDKALEFEGETGPYLQYTHARCCSIIKKSNTQTQVADDLQITYKGIDTHTFELVKLISRFDDTVLSAAQKYEPSILARLLLDIAQAFNRFYLSNRVLGQLDQTTKMRLKIVDLTKRTLKKGLDLLLIQAPEKM